MNMIHFSEATKNINCGLLFYRHCRGYFCDGMRKVFPVIDLYG